MSIQKKSAVIFIFLSLFCLTSCQRWIGDLLPARANSEMTFSDRDGLSAEFKQGWDDGCEVGMASGSNTFYQMFYRNNRADGYKMTSSPDYKTAWGNAFWFCYRTDWVRQKSSIWGSIFGGYK